MIGTLKFIGRHFITIALVVMALIVGGYISGSVESVRQFFFPQSTVYVIPNLTIVNSIKGIGQLVTVTSEIATTDVKVEIHQGFLNAGFYSASHIAIGAIEAGINFDEIDEDNIQFQDDTYTVSLPAPIVTSCRIKYIDQNEHSITLLSADWDMVRQIAHAEALEQFAQDMIEVGILEQAAEEAALYVGGFVQDLTGYPASIEFLAGSDQPSLPKSCQPIAPSGWERVADGGWKRAN